MPRNQWRWGVAAVAVLAFGVAILYSGSGHRETDASRPSAIVDPRTPLGLPAPPALRGATADSVEADRPVERELRALVVALLYDAEGDQTAAMRLNQLARSGLVPRPAVSRAIFHELDADVRSAKPRLRNVGPTAHVLLSDDAHDPGVAADLRAYAAIVVLQPSQATHRRLYDLLEPWFGTDNTALLQQLTAQLASASAGIGFRRALEEALKKDQRTALGALRRSIPLWGEQGRIVSNTAEALGVLTRETWTGGQALSEFLSALMEFCDEEQRDATESRGPVASVSQFGTGIAAWLAGATSASPSQREILLNALGRMSVPLESEGGCFFQSVALSGAGDGDRAAIDRPRVLHESAGSRAVRNTALINLGSLVTVDEYLRLSRVSVDGIPANETESLDLADVFSGMFNVIINHPEDEERIGRIVGATLDRLVAARRGGDVVQFLLQRLRRHPLAAARASVATLKGHEDASIRALATQALESIDRNAGAR